MALVAAKCTECGAAIEVDDTKEAGVCKHCGTAFITEKAINNYTIVNNVTNNFTKIVNGKEQDAGEEEFAKGLTNLKLKKYDLARKNFDRAIRENPGISKYYFYWCLAESENFSNLNIFLGHNDYLYQLADDGEDTHNIESFFALTTKEESKSLSKEYNIDLENNFDGLVEWCVNQFIQGVNPDSHYNFYNVWIGALNKLEKETSAYDKLFIYGMYYLVKVVTSVYDKVVEDKSCQYIDNSKRDTIYFMINYMLSEGIYPLETSLKKCPEYVGAVELGMDLSMYYLEDTINKLNSGELKAREIDDDTKGILTSFYKGRCIYNSAEKREKKGDKKGFFSKLLKR